MTHRFCFVNISGITFCISNRILRRHPYTKLASVFEITHTNGVSGTDYESAVFFDRNPVIFSSILDFYRTGQLHVPHSFCYSILKEELDFWQIDIGHLAECCVVVREDYKKHEKEVKDVQRVFGDDEVRGTPVDGSTLVGLFVSPFRHRLNHLFNNLDNQRVYFAIYFFCVVIHLISYIVQSDVRIEITRPEESLACSQLVNSSLELDMEPQANASSLFRARANNFVKIKYSKYFLSSPAFTLRLVDLVCMLFFITDIVLRGLAAQTPSIFAAKIGNWVDILCTCSNIVAYAISLRSSDGVTFFMCKLEVLTIYLILEIFRVLRLARLLQFASKYNGIIVLLLTVRNSLYELGLLLAALGSGVVLFGSLAFIAEIGDDSSRISSFPVGFWWAVVTMTTLGYGDVYPATVFGYIIGSLCAISGVIFMAVQVPVIGNKFNAFYTYACEQAATTAKKKHQ